MSDESPAIDRARARAIADANVKNASSAYSGAQAAYNKAVSLRSDLNNARTRLFSLENRLTAYRNAIGFEMDQLNKSISSFERIKSEYETALSDFHNSIDGALHEIELIRREAERAKKHAETIISSAEMLTGNTYTDTTEVFFCKISALEDNIENMERYTEQIRSISRMLGKERTGELNDSIMRQTEEKMNDMAEECFNSYRTLSEKCTALRELKEALTEYLR